MRFHVEVSLGKPGKHGYHNKAWAAIMRGVGLMPVSLSHPGKQTGPRVSDEVMPGGPFEAALSDLISGGALVTWIHQAELQPLPEKVKKRRQDQKDSKTAYACPRCERRAWARPGAELVCGRCLKKEGVQSWYVPSPENRAERFTKA